MVLFSKEKELIFKIVNGILLLWLVGAIAFSVSNIIDIAMPRPVNEKTYEEYATLNCMKEELEDSCKIRYDQEKFDTDNNQYSNKTTLLASLANVVIVGSTMFFLNKEKQKNKK